MKLTLDKITVLRLVVVGSIAFALTIASAHTSSTREGALVITEPTKEGSFFIANISEKNVNEVISPLQSADFTFNAIVANWELTGDTSEVNGNEHDEHTHATGNTTEYFNLEVRFLHETWSKWIPVEKEIDSKDASVVENQSRVIAVKPTDTFQYKITVRSAEDIRKIRSLSFTYLDTTDGPNHFLSLAAFSGGNQELKIISREQWGADESLRFDENGQELWEKEYYTPKKFVIHHTAGEAANKNAAASVRAIYYWHAKGRGWGDIGYNYLIDSDGNIYEGRSGGDGVVGGHAYMRNQNTIGIAILGCYQSSDANPCSTPDHLTPAAQTALDKLIAVKSQQFAIDPNGISPFHGEYLPNVMGHQDVGATNCPGNLLYNQLGLIRDESKVQLAGLPEQTLGEHGAELVSVSSQQISIPQDQTRDVLVSFKNTGTTVWRGYEDDHVEIADAAIKGNLVALTTGYTLSFASATPTQNAGPGFKLNDGNVAPGEIGHFVMTLEPNTTIGETTDNYTLAWSGKGYFPNTDFAVTVNTIPAVSEYPDGAPAAEGSARVTLSSHTIPTEFAAEETYPATVSYTNTGTTSLYKDSLRLKIVYGDGHVSPFRNPSWYSEWAMIPPSEDVITPGEDINFSFNLVAPDVSVLFPHTFELYLGDQLMDSFINVFNVVESYSAAVTAENMPVALRDTWRTKVTITLQNTGTKTWNGYALITGTPGYKYNRFIDTSWLSSKTILKSNDGVEPGEQIDLQFMVDPAYLSGTYRHFYKLTTNDGEEVPIDGKDVREFITRVDPVR